MFYLSLIMIKILFSLMGFQKVATITKMSQENSPVPTVTVFTHYDCAAITLLILEQGSNRTVISFVPQNSVKYSLQLIRLLGKNRRINYLAQINC